MTNSATASVSRVVPVSVSGSRVAMSTPKYKIKDLEAVLQVDGELKNVRVTRLSPPGENYLSVVLGIEADVDKDGRVVKKNAVAKCIPPGERKFVHFHEHSMKNEIRWYTDIVPLFREFAREHGLSGDLFPAYWGSRIGEGPTPDPDCVLLLENLKPEGYDNDDRYVGCDLVTSKAVLKTLALFHAIPLGLKYRSPARFKVFRDYIDNCKFPDMDPPPEHHLEDGEDAYATPEKAFVEAVNNILECRPYLDKLIPYVSQPIGPPDCNTIGDEPWSTVSHNDVWVNNIMIKRRNDGEEPLIKLVDFQMCGYKSFALDVVFFLLTSVINDVLRESFDDLIRHYYEELTKNLATFKVDLDLTYDKYLEELEQAARSSEIAHSLVFSNIVFGEKGTGVDIAVEEFNPMVHMTKMIQNMGENQREKIVLIASECAKRNWL